MKHIQKDININNLFDNTQHVIIKDKINYYTYKKINKSLLREWSLNKSTKLYGEYVNWDYSINNPSKTKISVSRGETSKKIKLESSLYHDDQKFWKIKYIPTSRPLGYVLVMYYYIPTGICLTKTVHAKYKLFSTKVNVKTSYHKKDMSLNQSVIIDENEYNYILNNAIQQYDYINEYEFEIDV